jgi:probable rRNA maturation factor
MPVFVSRRAPRSPRLEARVVRRLAEHMLRDLGVVDSELSILLCDDLVIHTLNLEHRNKDKPTDVLSFPQAEFLRPEVVKPGNQLDMLGDVVISLDTAQRQAQGRRRPLLEEVRFLLAHGVLHLLGYDHMTQAEKAVMTKRTRQLVKAAPLPLDRAPA